MPAITTSALPSSEATPVPVAHAQPPWKLMLGALGVVFGDIGTSPLYAFRESVKHFTEGGTAASEAHILGIVSCVIWALVLIVTLQYCLFILRADNRGEGGALALLALIARRHVSGRAPRWLLFFGLAGTALLFADGMLTPAISVLGAVEGLDTHSKSFEPWIAPIALAILAGLFMFQRRGTAGLGALFGPIMIIWFIAIVALGLPRIIEHPNILRAVDPSYAFALLSTDWTSFLVLGSIVLVITGGEALFADLGHFGRRPIRRAWLWIVLPSLLISYAGQGAFLLDNLHPGGIGHAVENPFYEMVPQPLLYPMVVLATMAAIIASQALISGIFSIVHQGIQLGLLPRLTVVHTSADLEGQVYVPQANLLLFLACAMLILFFRDSSALASAYGIAVTGSMIVTSVLFHAAMKSRWGSATTLTLTLLFLALDVPFLVANLPKLPTGGWVPFAVGALVLIIMTTWIAGTEAVRRRLQEMSLPLPVFKEHLERDRVARIPGAAVFLTRGDLGAPPMLCHHVKHSHALHEKIILLTVMIEHVPEISPVDRLSIDNANDGFYRVHARYGYRDSPNLGEVLRELETRGVPIDANATDIFVGHSTIVPNGSGRMSRWRAVLFQALMRNSRPASTYFSLPSDQVEEVGVRIEL